jgi:Family of unknown function (DUF5908)
MPVKINLLQITSTIREGDEEATQSSSGGSQDMSERMQDSLAEMETRILQECMQMILEAMDKQQER